jgi:hypothetical protein
MHRPSLLYLLAAGGAAAALQRLVPNAGAVSPAALFGRQADECTSHSTCAECYGKGYVVCDTIGCFNPDKFQQCCKDACESVLSSRLLRGTDNRVSTALCVGKTNKCCSDWVSLLHTPPRTFDPDTDPLAGRRRRDRQGGRAQRDGPPAPDRDRHHLVHLQPRRHGRGVLPARAHSPALVLGGVPLLCLLQRQKPVLLHRRDRVRRGRLLRFVCECEPG